MYSTEIDELLKSRNYVIDSDTYWQVCHYSPQIIRVKYTPFDGGYFEIWTDDNFYWKFWMTSK